jgi:hypothetical protein
MDLEAVIIALKAEGLRWIYALSVPGAYWTIVAVAVAVAVVASRATLPRMRARRSHEATAACETAWYETPFTATAAR